MSPIAQEVLNRLEDTRQRWWFFTLSASTFWALSGSLSLFWLFAALDAFLFLPRYGLVVALTVWAAATLALVWIVIHRLFRGLRTLEGTARCIESENPELQSHLINLVQLSEDEQNANASFRFAAVDQAAREIERFSLTNIRIRQGRIRRFLYSLQTPRDLAEAAFFFGLLILLTLFGNMLIPNWSNAAARLARPWEFVPLIGKVGITVSPGAAEVLLDTLEPRQRTDNKTLQNRTLLFYRPEGEKSEESLPLLLKSEPSGPVSDGFTARTYQGTIPVVSKPLRYRVEVGNSQSEIYRLRTIDKPGIAKVTLTYRFPKYMKREPLTTVTRTPDLLAPQYTNVELAVKPNTSVTSGRLDWEGGGVSGDIREDGNLLRATIPLLRNTSYKIRLRNGGIEDPQPRLNNIRIETDREPIVEMLRPNNERRLHSGNIFRSLPNSATISG